jgi:hypothetical protein
MILPESPRDLAMDGSLAAWGAFVVAKGLPTMVTLATLVLLVIRIMIAWRKWRDGVD